MPTTSKWMDYDVAEPDFELLSKYLKKMKTIVFNY